MKLFNPALMRNGQCDVSYNLQSLASGSPEFT